MSKRINADQMASVRRSLAEAGIYFDQLYINQAYFHSQITVNEPTKKHSQTNQNFWRKLLCGSRTKQTTIATPTTLIVRDDRQLRPSAQHIYDRRRYHPSISAEMHANIPLPARRRPPPIIIHSVPQSHGKEIIADVDDDFVV